MENKPRRDRSDGDVPGISCIAAIVLGVIYLLIRCCILSGAAGKVSSYTTELNEQYHNRGLVFESDGSIGNINIRAVGSYALSS
jgi:uncharacterized membrane protein